MPYLRAGPGGRQPFCFLARPGGQPGGSASAGGAAVRPRPRAVAMMAAKAVWWRMGASCSIGETWGLGRSRPSPLRPDARMSALFLQRAGVEPEDRIGRAGAQNAGQQRDDADQVEPAIGALLVEREARDQRGANEDAKCAVYAADVFLEHVRSLSPVMEPA